MTKLVRATALGFYNGAMRNPGDEFEVPDNATAKWFQAADRPYVPEAKEPEPTPVALSEMNKGTKSFVDVFHSKKK